MNKLTFFLVCSIIAFVLWSVYVAQRVYWCGTYGHGTVADAWGRCMQLEDLE